jgi:hypothetical protein
VTLLTGAEVRAAALATLQAQLPAVLLELGARLGVELPAPGPHSWVSLEDFRSLSDQQSPSIIVTCSGLPQAPREDEDSWQPLWRLRAFAVVRGNSYEETADRVTHYCAAIRTVWARNRSLGGIATGGKWQGELYTELDRSKTRTIAAGSVTYDFLCPVTADVPGVTAETVELDLTAYPPAHPAL